MPAAKRTTRKRAARTSPNKRAKPADAIALLRRDHEDVGDLLQQYEGRRRRLHADAKRELALKICKALSVHAQIEEEIFYPAVSRQAHSVGDLLAEAKVEHTTLKELIGQLQEADRVDEMFDAQVKVLGEYVQHHVREEHRELFPKVRKAQIDLIGLGEQLAERKTQLSGEG
jgi:hemerythrin superfamily protein